MSTPVHVFLAVLGMVLAGPAFAQAPGMIEGQIIYPSDGVPPDLDVCADSLERRDTTCNARQFQNRGRYFYSLQVPAGRYHVYASTDEKPAQKAFYNEFVSCGMGAECKSHKLHVVDVGPGETVRGVDPADWSTPQTSR